MLWLSECSRLQIQRRPCATRRKKPGRRAQIWPRTPRPSSFLREFFNRRGFYTLDPRRRTVQRSTRRVARTLRYSSFYRGLGNVGTAAVFAEPSRDGRGIFREWHTRREVSHFQATGPGGSSVFQVAFSSGLEAGRDHAAGRSTTGRHRKTDVGWGLNWPDCVTALSPCGSPFHRPRRVHAPHQGETGIAKPNLFVYCTGSDLSIFNALDQARSRDAARSCHPGR